MYFAFPLGFLIFPLTIWLALRPAARIFAQANGETVKERIHKTFFVCGARPACWGQQDNRVGECRRSMPIMEKHALILTTTKDFLGKFEQENVRILQRLGYTVHYVTNQNEPSYIPGVEAAERLGTPVHHIEIARSPFLLQDNEKALRQILGLLRKYPVRLLHCHTPVGGLLGRLAGRLSGEKNLLVIYTAHGFHFYRGAPLWNRVAYYQVEKWLARYTDALIVINQEDEQTARRFHLKPGGRVYRIPGVGLDREKFRPLAGEERKAARERLGLDDENFFLVSVGELNENKNQKIILDALELCRERDPGFHAIRYGLCGDGFFRDRIEGWIREKGLEDTVTLYGHCPHVPQILGCADAAAFPSIREGLGMAGLEALAMGIPVLAADNRGTREYMLHGKNGLVCPPGDAERFARGIETLRAMDKQERREMAARCRESTEPFDKRHARTAMQKIYEAADRRVEQKSHGKQRQDQRRHGRV